MNRAAESSGPRWQEKLRNLFQLRIPGSSAKVSSGIYSYRREAAGNVTRFHLRVEEDGTGLLLANAAVAARLSPTGVIIAKGLLEKNADDEITRRIRDSFRITSESEVQADIQRLNEFIETLSNPDDNYPIFNLDDPYLTAPQTLMAPFHAQLRVASLEKTIPVLEKLWHSGVMHVTFSASPNSSESHAVADVERAEDLGMISGVRGFCSWFSAEGFIDRIALAGVDYLLIPLPRNLDLSGIQDCIIGCKKWEICPAVEIPLLKENLKYLDSTLASLSQQGVRNIFTFAVSSAHQPEGLDPGQLIEAALMVEELSQSRDVRYVWLPPVSGPGPLEKLLDEGPRTAGDVSIRVEPDGSVYPTRGPAIAAGNLNLESLETIWNREVFLKYRQRIETPTRCEVCPGLEICSADCPADPRAWAEHSSADSSTGEGR